MKNKILIFDALHPISFGEDLFLQIKKYLPGAKYVNSTNFKKRSFYRLKQGLLRFFYKKILRNKELSYYPKLNQKEFYDDVASFVPSVIVSIGRIHEFVDGKVLKKLKNNFNIHLVYYDTDSAAMFGSVQVLSQFIRRELKSCDLILSFSKIMAEYFVRQGLPAYFLPYGFNAIRLPAKQGKTKDIAFIGGPGIRRAIYLELIRDFNLSIYGKRWKRWASLVSPELASKITYQDVWGEELASILNQSKIILNINNQAWHSVDSGVNLRVFEALAAKQFLLTEYIPELEDLFEIGKDLETFRSVEELKEKLDFYLKNEKERNLIAEHGHQTFMQKYTMPIFAEKMVKKIQSELGFD